METNNIHIFAAKILGVGDMSKLPSGSTQVRDMMKPYIIRIWKLKHPVRLLYDCFSSCLSESSIDCLNLLLT